MLLAMSLYRDDVDSVIRDLVENKTLYYGVSGYYSICEGITPKDVFGSIIRRMGEHINNSLDSKIRCHKAQGSVVSAEDIENVISGYTPYVVDVLKRLDIFKGVEEVKAGLKSMVSPDINEFYSSLE